MSTRENSRIIAFLGAGIMAQGMIKNLQRAGYRLRLYNRTQSRITSLVNQNDIICSSPREAALGADVIISSVLDDQASKEVWWGKDGALKGARKSTICVETSTTSVKHIDEWAKRIKKQGLVPIDSPVTGSKNGAETGSLALFLGCSKESIKVNGVLEAISEQQFYFGSTGNGMRFKLIYNMLGGSILVALAEAISLAKELGLDKQQVVEVLASNKQGWSAAAAKSKGSQMVNRDHEQVACALSVMSKDLSYATSSRAHLSEKLLVSSAASSILNEAGFGNMDMSAVIELFIKEQGGLI